MIDPRLKKHIRDLGERERRLNWAISQANLRGTVSPDDYKTHAAYDAAFEEEWDRLFEEAIVEFDNDPLETDA